MAFYPKKLNSLRELELEKLALEKQLKKLEADDLFSLKDLKPTSKGKKADTGEGGGMMGAIIDMLPISNPWLDLAMSFVKRRFAKPAAAKATPEKPTQPGILQKGATIAKNAAFDVLTGYLKWKAIELSYKGIVYLVKKRREEQLLRKLEENAGQ